MTVYDTENVADKLAIKRALSPNHRHSGRSGDGNKIRAGDIDGLYDFVTSLSLDYNYMFTEADAALQTLGGGSVTAHGGYIALATGAIANDYATALHALPGLNGSATELNFLEMDQSHVFIMQFRAKFIPSKFDYRANIGIGSETDFHNAPLLKDSILVRLKDDVLYAVSSNNNSESAEVIAGVDATLWHTYRIEYLFDNWIRFYIDDVLVKIKTTMLPTVNNDVLYIGAGVKTEWDWNAGMEFAGQWKISYLPLNQIL